MRKEAKHKFGQQSALELQSDGILFWFSFFCDQQCIVQTNKTYLDTKGERLQNNSDIDIESHVKVPEEVPYNWKKKGL